MAASSCIKTVGNEVYASEHPGEYMIKNRGFFIVRLEGLSTSTIAEDSNYFLKTPIDGVAPSCVHYTRDVLTLFYKCPTTLCGGRYNEIISYFVGTVAAKRRNDSIRCNVVEFKTKSDLYVYMCYRLYHLYLEFLLEKCPKLTSTELIDHTATELDAFLVRCGVDQSVFTSTQKFGDYHKLTSKNVIVNKAASYDVETENEYIRFIY